MAPYRILIREDDPLWAAMLERVVLADPLLELCGESEAADADVAVLGEGRLHEAPSLSCTAIALVAAATSASTGELSSLGITRVLTRSTPSDVLGATLRTAAGAA